MPLFCDRTIPEPSPKTSPGPPTAWPPRRARTALPKCSAPATVHSTRRTRSGAAIPIPATSSVTSLGPSATNNPAAFRPFLSPSERIVCISALVNIFIIDYANMPRIIPHRLTEESIYDTNVTKPGKTTAPPESPQVEYRHSDPQCGNHRNGPQIRHPYHYFLHDFVCAFSRTRRRSIHAVPRDTERFLRKIPVRFAKQKTTAYLCISETILRRRQFQQVV